MRYTNICVFGEVLFDHFPDGHRVLGGAPFNVAWHLNAFGETPHLRSALGDDAEAEEIRSAMIDWGMDLSGVLIDPGHPTGQVTVSLQDGEPSYDIVPDCAYDHIPEVRTVLHCDLLYHGTLALRSPQSAAALDYLRNNSPQQVFMDVNLRNPWWERVQVLGLMDHADWVKLNRDELDLLAPEGAGGDLAAKAAALKAAHGLTGLVVTLGAEGAMGLVGEEAPVRISPAAEVEVVDAVGAGDAFASVLILGIIRGWGLATTLERAQAFASRIVGQPGATAADPALYEPFIDRWGLAPAE